ncbi:hypothetical protein Cni_G10269 [Canna indica]|uniref:Uncharacterized protein n=1 Tax=Canna indica TaxID=4628 RepID=A0AAQ3K420_9LILI|nr:hypothetical protein Cni_G10269 [Canna indica]
MFTHRVTTIMPLPVAMLVWGWLRPRPTVAFMLYLSMRTRMTPKKTRTSHPRSETVNLSHAIVGALPAVRSVEHHQREPLRQQPSESRPRDCAAGAGLVQAGRDGDQDGRRWGRCSRWTRMGRSFSLFFGRTRVFMEGELIEIQENDEEEEFRANQTYMDEEDEKDNEGYGSHGLDVDDAINLENENLDDDE